jgi:glycosyltransferase involved in cell wall biosynthesis
MRPLALLFVVFHLLAPPIYLAYLIRTGTRFDIVQSIESNLGYGRLIYTHFSHTSYLRRIHPRRQGWRGTLRWLDHRLHAWVEQWRYPAASLLVVPSAGLAEELTRDFDIPQDRIRVIANPVAVQGMRCPRDFERDCFRKGLGLQPSDFTCIFFALGHFERKGLHFIFEALTAPDLRRVHLLVVGGEPDLIARYTRIAETMQIAARIHFVGKQSDVRPFLWSADVFVLPSAYETFSLAAYEAAAAGLPLLAPPLSGIRELLREGRNGFYIEHDAASVTLGLGRITSLTAAERQALGEHASRVASEFSAGPFVEAWRSLYRDWNGSQSFSPAQGQLAIRSGSCQSRLST